MRPQKSSATFDDANYTRGYVQAMRSIGLVRPRRRLPRMIPPKTVGREYAGELLALVAEVKAAYALLAELPSLLAEAKWERRDGITEAADRRDGAADRLRSLLAAGRTKLAAILEKAPAIIRKYAERTSWYQKEQLKRVVRAGLGVDVPIDDRAVPSLTEAFELEATVEVTRVLEQVAGDMEQQATGSLARGVWLPVSDRGEKAARAAAHWQVQRFYSRLNQARQRALGVTRYTWISQRDDRVRDLHQHLDGQVFSYDDPNRGDHGMDPGEPRNCRCFASPVFQ